VTFDEFAAAIASSSHAPPAFKLWTRNLKRDRDTGALDRSDCDEIADAIFRLSPEATKLNYDAVADVLGSATSPVASRRMCTSATCTQALSLVTTVAMIARHYAKKFGYADTDADIERCLTDISTGILNARGLDGRLRGRLDCAWFTDANHLDAELSKRQSVAPAGSASQADYARSLLGLSLPAAEKLVRVDVSPEHAVCAIAKPTTVDAAGYPYFLASRREDRHGWTLDLESLQRSLPEWVIQGLDASAVTKLSFLGRTGAAPNVDWPALFDRFDQGEL